MYKGIVKKLGMIALAALFTASVAACQPQNPSEQGATPTPAQETPFMDAKVTAGPIPTQLPMQKLDGYSYQFVRIAYNASASSMKPYVISSVDALREALVSSLPTTSKDDSNLDAYLKEYDEEFFKSNYILVFNLTFSSGSVVPSIKSVKLDNGTVMIETAGNMSGDVGTADMASHMCLLALDADRFPVNSSFSVTGVGTADASTARKG